MSDIFRKSLLSRLPDLPPTRAPWADEPLAEGDEEVEELAEESEGIGELPAGQMKPPKTRGPNKADMQDYSPLSASGYFDQAIEVQPTGSPCTFRVYLTPPSTTTSSNTPSGPNLGPGPAGPAPKIQTQQQTNPHGTYLICHHGGGSGGLSFAALAKEVKRVSGGEMGVLAFDCRGHGKTRTEPVELENDLSAETLLSDFISLIETIFPNPKESPSFIMMGHSMGASPTISSVPLLIQKGYLVPGTVVLDVVEGTAVESLPMMESILGKRPGGFQSVVDGIWWHVTSNSIRNPTSARLSVPSILTPASPSPSPSPNTSQTWRTPLLQTSPFWLSWYTSLSSRFLALPSARLLVLAGQERLDRELMVGQMQGKFQLDVMEGVGHYLHEDNPAALASTLITFWRRNTRVLVLPPKIGSAPKKSGEEEVVAVRPVGQS
ncbi:protein phosphatase methylesterase 1 [Cryptococcus wingfieldii CBS 7118]|uniref:Protein phosphatase methylesterase 1 n=1 Tax=Cryptococcus wingfieldii CBS 7118 TaxID=1295528 RepID=A0A1E3JXE2_9TREE|nr:protein phosphatase methylesterase 1 [Cryptococcus wingfieldii CBS 7118]ODO05426.1 protein phosphatase methylesterase 1 [Cryptococcus wingfieldii CBS 7118]